MMTAQERIEAMPEGYVFKADVLGIAGSSCMAMVRRGYLTIDGKYDVTITLPDGREIIREANIYRRTWK